MNEEEGDLSPKTFKKEISQSIIYNPKYQVYVRVCV